MNYCGVCGLVARESSVRRGGTTADTDVRHPTSEGGSRPSYAWVRESPGPPHQQPMVHQPGDDDLGPPRERARLAGAPSGTPRRGEGESRRLRCPSSARSRSPGTPLSSNSRQVERFEAAVSQSAVPFPPFGRAGTSWCSQKREATRWTDERSAALASRETVG